MSACIILNRESFVCFVYHFWQLDRQKIYITYKRSLRSHFFPFFFKSVCWSSEDLILTKSFISVRFAQCQSCDLPVRNKVEQVSFARVIHWTGALWEWCIEQELCEGDVLNGSFVKMIQLLANYHCLCQTIARDWVAEACSSSRPCSTPLYKL